MAFASPPAQEDRLHHRAVLKALSSLPEDQRSVLLLVSVEDLSYAEAAAVLDIPLGSRRLANGCRGASGPR
jgi:DNA-directed RNA polymerase specialized sigma24 family protein